MLPSMDNIRAIVWWLVKYGGGGLFSYAAPRLLVEAGVPLDEWIVRAGKALSVQFSAEVALWGVTTVIALVLFIWSHSRKRHEWVGEQNTAETTPNDPPIFDRPAKASSQQEVHHTENNVPLPATTGNDANTVGTKPYYSSGDRERIAQAFIEISDVLNKQGAALSDLAQEVCIAWDRNRSQPSFKGLDIGDMQNSLAEVEHLSSVVEQNLYVEITKKYQLYSEIITDVLAPMGAVGGKAVRRLRDSGRAVSEGLTTVEASYNADPAQKKGLYDLFEPTAKAFHRALADFHDWRTTVNERIGEHKRTTLVGQ